MSTTAEIRFNNTIARITFSNNAGLNVLDEDCRAAVRRCLDDLGDHPNIRFLVLAAEGKVFLAGADLKELRKLHEPTALEYAKAGQMLTNEIEDLSIISIAAINGACAGGGFEMALACDLRIAAASARIGLPETSLGLVPGWGGTYRLTRDVGPAVARQVILGGELLTADEALRLGLIHQVVADDQLQAATDAWIERLKLRGPKSLLRAKRVINGHASGFRAERLTAEAREFAACFASNESAEGLAAFLEKRPPVWEGER